MCENIKEHGQCSSTLLFIKPHMKSHHVFSKNQNKRDHLQEISLSFIDRQHISSTGYIIARLSNKQKYESVTP